MSDIRDAAFAAYLGTMYRWPSYWPASGRMADILSTFPCDAWKAAH